MQEQMREQKRILNRAVREIDRERLQLQNSEKKLIAEIKALAKKGEMNSVKILAKDLVRGRKQVTKFYEIRSQLQAIEMRLQTVKSLNSMADAVKNVTKSMAKMNKMMNLPRLNEIMREFCRQNEQMDLTEEMMGDAVDMALDGGETEEETDQVVAQVLGEIGVEYGDQLESGHMAAVGGVREESKSQGVSDLEARFNNLK